MGRVHRAERCLRAAVAAREMRMLCGAGRSGTDRVRVRVGVGVGVRVAVRGEALRYG